MSGRDLTNQTFGRLTALRKVGRQKNGNALWECMCSCGNKAIVDCYRLTHGVTKSCGCLRRENSRNELLSNEATKARMGDITPLKKWIHTKESLKVGVRNRSGFVGVSYDNHAAKWVARMMVNGEYILNEQFDSKDEAILRRKTVEKVYKK